MDQLQGSWMLANARRAILVNIAAHPDCHHRLVHAAQGIIVRLGTGKQCHRGLRDPAALQLDPLVHLWIIALAGHVQKVVTALQEWPIQFYAQREHIHRSLDKQHVPHVLRAIIVHRDLII